MMNQKKSSARSAWKYISLLPLLFFAVISLNAVKAPAYLETKVPAIVNEEEPTAGVNLQIPDSYCQEESARKDDLIEKFANLNLKSTSDQTFQYWQWPKAQAALIQKLQQDGIINKDDKINMVTCEDKIYVNGKQLNNPVAYQTLAHKYNVIIEDGWRFKKQGQKIMITNSVDDIEILQKEIMAKLKADGLIKSIRDNNVLKIYGDDLYINNQLLPNSKLAAYHQLLDKYRITPAPGKVIIMNAKKSDFGVGYRTDNTFAGTWLLGD